MKFLFFVALLVSFLSNSVRAQKYSFIPYSTSEGLPQSQVTAITQDAKGYLWVGTLGGLARFNGGVFETYSSENGLLNNRISFLTIIDKDLWIGHEGGLSLYRNNVFTKWKIEGEDQSSNVKSIINFKDEIYVASHDGLYKLVNNKLVKILDKTKKLKHIRFLKVVEDKLFIATMEGVYETRDLKIIKVIKSLEDVNSSSIAVRNNELIVTSYFEGVYSVNLDNHKTHNVLSLSEDLMVKGVFVDSKNNSWLNTNNGIVKLDEKNIATFIDESKGLSFGLISVIFEDNEGSIWIGTLGKGLLRFPSPYFVHFDKSLGLISDLIVNISEDKDKNLWFGSFDKGLFKFKDNKSTPIIESTNTVWCSLFDVAGSKWFGTDAGLLRIQNGIPKFYYYQDGLVSDAVTALFRLSDNRLIVGGTEGFSVFENEKFHRFKLSKSLGIVRDFTMIGNELYIATSKGLYVKKKNEIVKIKKIDKPVSCIELDHQNNLWVGTEEGLFVREKNEFKKISLSSLPSSNLITFLESHGKELFIGTNNGLFVIEKLTENSVFYSYFGEGEGLVDVETNLNSSFFDSKGFLWFGTSSALVRFDYKNSIKTNSPPILNLKESLLNYSKEEFHKFSKYKNGTLSKIVLPFNKNNLAFEIDGVSLSNHSNLNYQFLLEGFDENWSPPTKNPVISFTGLSDNNYTLHMRAIDENGIFSNEIIVPFVINPPFYKTFWFVSLVLLILFSFIYLIFKIKVKRELEHSNNKMLSYKSKLMSLEQKSLNASMNRHFIFNALNSIQYFINSQDRLSANRYLTNFAKLIRKNLDSTNEDGNMVSLDQELEGLELYLSLEAMRFKDKFDYKIICEGVDKESIIIPAMLLQPFIENAIIHGVLPNEDLKGLITVEMKIENSVLLIQIDDNGIGIKNSLKMKDSSQGDHKSQGMEITAKRIDLIKKISNKGFEIIGPFQVGGIDSDIQGTRVILKIPFENLED